MAIFGSCTHRWQVQAINSRGENTGWCVDCKRIADMLYKRRQRDKIYAARSLAEWNYPASRSRKKPKFGRDTSARAEIIRQERRETFRKHLQPMSVAMRDPYHTGNAW